MKRERQHWRQMGQTLASIHSVKGDCYGLDTDCYWGDLYQDNSALDDWPQFFWERRLAPRLRAAVDCGRLPLDFVSKFERLSVRLPRICGPRWSLPVARGCAQ